MTASRMACEGTVPFPCQGELTTQSHRKHITKCQSFQPKAVALISEATVSSAMPAAGHAMPKSKLAETPHLTLFWHVLGEQTRGHCGGVLTSFTQLNKFADCCDPRVVVYTT